MPDGVFMAGKANMPAWLVGLIFDDVFCACAARRVGSG